MELSQTQALFLSIAIEAAAGVLLLAWTRWAHPWRGVAAAALGTLLTHPLVWWGVDSYEDNLGYWPVVALAEAFAFAAEIIVWRVVAKLTWLRAMAASAGANGLSLVAGILIQMA